MNTVWPNYGRTGKGKAGTRTDAWELSLWTGWLWRKQCGRRCGFVQVAVEWWVHWPCGIIEECMVLWFGDCTSPQCLFWDSLILWGIFLCYLNYLLINYGVTSLVFYSCFYFLIWALSTNHYCLCSGCNNTNKDRGGSGLRIYQSGVNAISPGWEGCMQSPFMISKFIIPRSPTELLKAAI